MEQHVISVKVYVAIFVTLLVLTALTIQIAFIDLGPLNTVVAMTIAVVKGMLVILFFMHLRYSAQLVKIFVVGGFIWLGILISLTVSDYASRDWIQQPTGWAQQSSGPLAAEPDSVPASAEGH
jgi:cytochrome c oxidase subunit IV